MKHHAVVGYLLILGFAGCAKEVEPVEQQERAPDPVMETPVTDTATAPLRTPSAEGARVFFITPDDDATLSGPVAIEFGIEGMNVVKAGDDQPHSGHHHLLIDTGLPELGLPIPADAKHIHFGDGSTTAELTLEPGQHTLQMLLGDHLHIPHDPPLVSDVITITVE